MSRILRYGSRNQILDDLEKMLINLNRAKNFELNNSRFNFKKDRNLNSKLKDNIRMAISLAQVLSERIKEN